MAALGSQSEKQRSKENCAAFRVGNLGFSTAKIGTRIPGMPFEPPTHTSHPHDDYGDITQLKSTLVDLIRWTAVSNPAPQGVIIGRERTLNRGIS